MSAGAIPLANAFVRVRADGTGFKADAEKVIGSVDGVGAGGRIGKVMGGALLGALGLAMAGVGAVLTVGMKESMVAEKLNAQFAAGIKSTGNAAHLSVGTMDALASSVAGYSGQSFESIGMTEQLLQTFVNIRNTGPNKIFDQATVAAADMAAKMGGDASGMAIKLGKALNDPVKGMTALSRVGVQFTASQKASIAAMMKHGDVAGAQKLILKELTTEFGGAAKAAGDTLPGQLAKSKVAFGEMSKSIVDTVLPAVLPGLTSIATTITTKVMPAVAGFAGTMSKAFKSGGITGVITTIGASITAALPGIQAQLAKWGTALWSWVQAAVPPLLVQLGTLWVQLETWIWTVALPALVAQLVKWGKAFVEWITPMIPPFLAKLGDLLTQLGNWMLTVALPAIGAHLLEWGAAFAKWIGPMIPPVLLALGELLLKLGGWLLTVALPAIVGKLGEWALAFAKWVPGAIVSMLKALIPMLGQLGTWIVTTAAPQLVVKLMEWSKAFGSWILTAIIEAPGKLLKLLGAVISWAAGVAPKILSTLGDLSGLLRNAGKSILQGLWDGMVAKFEEVKTFVGGIGSWIAAHKGPLSYDRALLVPHGSAIMAGFNESLMTGFGLVQSNVSGMAGRLSIGSLDFATSSVRSAAVTRSATGGGGAGQPAIWVQNPWTGEYHEAKMAGVVDQYMATAQIGS